MNYITPEIEVIELDMIDVIQTSSNSIVPPTDSTEKPLPDKDDALPVG